MYAREQTGLGWVAAAMAAQAVVEYGIGKSKMQKARLDSCQDGANALVDGIIHVRTQLKKLGVQPYTPWWSEMAEAGGNKGPYSGGLMAALNKLNVLSEIEGGHAPFDLYADLIRPAEDSGAYGGFKAGLSSIFKLPPAGQYEAWLEKTKAIPAGYIGTRQAAEEAAEAAEGDAIAGLGILGRKRKKKANVCERTAAVLSDAFEELMADWKHAKEKEAAAGQVAPLGPEINVAGFGIPLWGIAAVAVLSWWSMRGARA